MASDFGGAPLSASEAISEIRLRAKMGQSYSEDWATRTNGCLALILAEEVERLERRNADLQTDRDYCDGKADHYGRECDRLTRERDEAIQHQQRLGAAMQDEIRGRHTAERERDKWKDRALGAEMGVGSLKSETALARHERDEMWEALRCDARAKETLIRERDEARAEVEQANADANALTLERDEWESRYLNVRADADEWQARTMQARAEINSWKQRSMTFQDCMEASDDENERLRARVANLERGIEAYRAEWDCRLPQGGRECSMGCCSCAWEREQREGADRDPTVL